MKRYSDWAPSGHDTRGLGLDDRQDWYVAPCTLNRDSKVWEESNWHAQEKRLGDDDVEVHRFGHWACGWFEIVLVAPDSFAYEEALRIEQDLEIYPLLDEDDVSDRQNQAACDVWQHCYSQRERIEYIRKHRSQFEFNCWTDMLACVRGKYFTGYAGDLLDE